MVVLPVDESLQIQSYKGRYSVFTINQLSDVVHLYQDDPLLLIDSNVLRLHQSDLEKVFSKNCRKLVIEANEKNKSLEMMPEYVKALVALKARRHQRLVAIGGGIVQDITCFLAATLFRGMDWDILPTTLLAQADSSIGSKSSINCLDTKNIVGTFTPPTRVIIYPGFLKTLSPTEIRSGIGEMLKVHALHSPEAFQNIAHDYVEMLESAETLRKYILASLKIKKKFIEEDEFDRDIRNLLNYGHTFGHALESATQFGIPHGIAVSMGMDMANFVSYKIGHCGQSVYLAMHKTLKTNYREYEKIKVDVRTVVNEMTKDKKNSSNSAVSVIIPDFAARFAKVQVPLEGAFYDACQEYLETARLQ